MKWGQCAEILTRSWGKGVCVWGGGAPRAAGKHSPCPWQSVWSSGPGLGKPRWEDESQYSQSPLPTSSSHFLQLRQKIENKGSIPSEKNSSNNKWTWRMLSLVVLDSRGVTCTAAETKRKNPLKWASSPCLLLRDTRTESSVSPSSFCSAWLLLSTEAQ